MGLSRMGLVKYIRGKGRYIRRQCWYIMTGIIYGLGRCWTGFDTRVDKGLEWVRGVKLWVLSGIGGSRLMD